ncbi:MAG: DNA topoisomerase VI subunit B [Phycisphaerae bacterium]|nr:DNA topoisomerase VI subunit B [Phycisphaerae bacterium]
MARKVARSEKRPTRRPAKRKSKPRRAKPKARPKATPTKAARAAKAPVTALAPTPAEKKPLYATAEAMAKAQRSISVSEFFAKNRHLLGFDNPRKALLTAVKEAVDNALDACEEAGILPVVEVTIEQIAETHFRVTVQDNGPGIVRRQIPAIFGQLLYGSKFHRLRMSRGQQGIGISAAGMYGLLTTGKPVRIVSRISPRGPAHQFALQIDTRTNRPVVMADQTVAWDCPHGTQVAIELEARYQRGKASVDDYLAQTAIANPHVTLIYRAPDGRCDTYPASTTALPPPAKEVRPHPHGIELGVLIKMMQDSKARTLRQFLTKEFSRVSPRVAGEVLTRTNLPDRARPGRLSGEDAKAIYQAIQQTRIIAPSSDCVVPIGQEALLAGVRQVVDAELCTAVTRSPAVYRGNPFIIEAALAYGRKEAVEAQPPSAKPKDARAATDDEEDAPSTAPTQGGQEGEAPLTRLIRFANRVPLLYQQSACAIYRAAAGLNWKAYGLPQARGALPSAALTIVVHMASVWVPFTSESKEAIASYPEILREVRLALQECGRKLGAHIRRGVRVAAELKKRGYIEKYIPAIGEALGEILDLKSKQVDRLCTNLKVILQRSRRF